ncbi:MAG: glycosyltransferase [Elusimicrobiaceae bacterium]|nr:glycosyltransferase [Elusimicrobiaceae bacterium]
MKLLYVITSTDVGGAETALVRLVQSLSPRHTVRVVSLKKCGPLAADLKALGASVTSLNMTGSGLGCVSKLKKEIETFKPDVVHAMLFRAIEFARLACAGRNVKLVTTPHFDLSQKPRWMRWLDRTLKSLDSVSIAESVSTFNYLRDIQHYPPQKTALITNSVKKSLFFKDNYIRTQMRTKNGFSDKDIIFISVARLAPVKNPVNLLQAFAQIVSGCPNAKLVFVGDGELRNDLENLIKVNFLEKKVLLAGEQKNINDWLNMADVFVLVSKEESLPLSLLEAQQVGLPCIVSKVGDMPKRVIHGKNGFVCNPIDEMLLSCLFTELYENKQLRARMGAESLAQTGGKKDSAAQYEQLYKQLLNL